MQSKNQKKQKQKTQKRQRKKFSRFPIYSSPRTAFPKQMDVALRYCDTKPFTSSGGLQSQVFRLNSLFDFDYTNTGKQPYQYDQLTAVYLRYRVLNVEIKLTCTNKALTDSVNFVMYVDNNTASQSTASLGMQMQFSDYQLAGSYYNSSSTRFLKKSYNIANVLGYPENIDEDLAALYSANPAMVAYLHLLGDPQAGTALNATWVMDATFYARFYDLTTGGDSLTKKVEEDTYLVLKKKS